MIWVLVIGCAVCTVMLAMVICCSICGSRSRKLFEEYESNSIQSPEDKIVASVGMPALLGQLAEECSELCKAALKYQRVLMNVNPTPVSEEDILHELEEEAEDVNTCLSILEYQGIKVSDKDQRKRKIERWLSRIEASNASKVD